MARTDRGTQEVSNMLAIHIAHVLTQYKRGLVNTTDATERILVLVARHYKGEK